MMSRLKLSTIFLLLAVYKADSQAVQFIKLGDATVNASLNYDALQSVIHRRPEVKDLPTAVISVAGVARSGKSFLLNLLVSYLTYLEKDGCDEGWEGSDMQVEGIKWAQSEKSVTNGMWMWDRPFVISTANGNPSADKYKGQGDKSEVAILLVDTQGTGDNERTQSLNTLIMYLSLQLSSVQMFNVWRYVTSDDLAALQLVSDFSDEAAQAEQKVFNSLVFLLRDYQASDVFGEDSFNAKIDSKDAGQQKVVTGLTKSFKTVTMFKMPFPGESISTTSVDKKLWRVKDIPGKFLKFTKKLFRRVLELGSSRVEENYWPTGYDLLEYFKNLKEHIDNGGLPEVPSPNEALQDIILYRAYQVAAKETQRQCELLMKAKPNMFKVYPTKDALEKKLAEIMSEIVAKFKKDGKEEKYAKTATWNKYKALLTATTELNLAKVYGLHDMQTQEEKARLTMEEIRKDNEITKQEQDKKIQALSANLEANRLQHEKDQEIFRNTIAQNERQMKELREQLSKKSGGGGFFGFLGRLIRAILPF